MGGLRTEAWGGLRVDNCLVRVPIANIQLYRYVGVLTTNCQISECSKKCFKMVYKFQFGTTPSKILDFLQLKSLLAQITTELDVKTSIWLLHVSAACVRLDC